MVLTYYAAGEANGNEGDLKTVTYQLLDGTTWKDHETEYFRYYKAGESGGFEHGLKYSLTGAAFTRLKNDPDVTDPFLASDAKVAEYADQYYEYDSEQRATKATIRGGLLTYTYAYEVSNHTPDYNNWTYKATMTRPDGAQEITYSNFISQPLLTVLKDGTNEWLTHTKYDNNANEIQKANPSAISSYDDTQADLGVMLKANEGLIELTDYYSTTTATETVPGGVDGHVQFQKIKEGSSGSPVALSETKYFKREVGSIISYPIASQTQYQSEASGGSLPSTTSLSYTWYPDSTSVQEQTTTLPIVDASQNGSGTANSEVSILNEGGQVIWQKDPRGFITYRAYDPVTNAMVQEIRDVDMSQVTGYPLKPNWTTPAGGGLHLITDYETDDFGRTTQTLGPVHNVDGQNVRTAGWTVYRDLEDETYSAQGYATGSETDYNYALVNPVQISRNSADGLRSDSITAVRATTDGKLSSSDCYPQSSWCRWSVSLSNKHGQSTTSRSYFDIPECGEGQQNVNYTEITFGYDASGRQNSQKTPGGTISRTVFDVRGNAIQSFVGTNDNGATDSDPTGAGAAGNNMKLVSQNEYDGGNAGGENNLTKTIVPVDDNPANDRITTFGYDFRNRQIWQQSELSTLTVNQHDNLNRVTKVQRYQSSSYPPLPQNLLNTQETFYDHRGRTYKSTQSDGGSNVLRSQNWYDAAGNTIKTVAAGAKDDKAFTKNEYDGLSRSIASYSGYYTGSGQESYSDAGTITAQNKIFEQSLTTYDNAGHVLLTTSYQRFHNATATGKLNLPTGADPKARVSYVANWYDGAGRSTTTANYGTNDNVSVTRSDLPPEPSDDILVTTTTYNACGEVAETTDPSGMITRTEYNDAGQTVRTIQNATLESGMCSDTNVTVEQEYNLDGQLKNLIAKNPVTGDQITRYLYGTTLTDSGIARHDLLVGEIYPDSIDSTDRITYTYNRQGQRITMQDQNGSMHAYDYDKLGRQTQDRVITLGTGVDGTVRRLQTDYDARGNVEAVTSYDNATVGSGSAKNQVERTYNGFNQVTYSYQDHNGKHSVNTPEVRYLYASGSENTIRRQGIIYPLDMGDGPQMIEYKYTDTDSDMLSRVDSLDEGQHAITGIAEYEYLGLNSFVKTKYTEPGIENSLISGGSSVNPYGGLDRFGRIIDMPWQESASPSNKLDHFTYGYDRASNRTHRENLVAPSGHDELYQYDSIHRLQSADRGDLDSSYTNITDPTLHQDWNLDATGNWNRFQSFDQNDSTNTLVQERSHNEANEIVDITDIVGPQSSPIAHDRNGNMTMVTRSVSEGSLTLTWDAWNRLVQIDDATSTVAGYQYDGLNRRIVKTVSGSDTHFFYSTEWQVLQETSYQSTPFPSVDRSYIWGIRYIDDLVMQATGTRYYALQDANWNVTSLCSPSASILERYQYSPYGDLTILTPTWTPRATSQYNNPYTYTGRRFDQESRIYYYRARYYDAKLGRFLGRDPIGYDAIGHNVYGYVLQNPLRFRDPIGTDVYLETGNDLLNPLNNAIHQNFCVDVWDENCDSVEPSGKTCFSFGFSLRACCGVVEERAPVPASHISGELRRKRTSCEQDQDTLRSIRQHVGHRGTYNPLTRNCRHFAQSWFDRVAGREQIYTVVGIAYDPQDRVWAWVDVE